MRRNTLVNPDEYLERIGAEKRDRPDFEYLAHLTAQHLMRVPFENLDLVAGRKIELKIDQLFEKVVRRGRGGYCFELNFLFRWLLTTLGFSVEMVSSRVPDHKTGIFGPEFDHMALLVRLDKTVLADVAFGDCCRWPLTLPEDRVDTPNGTFRVRPSDEEGRFVLEKHMQGAWTPKYDFSLHPHELPAFYGMHNYHQTSPESYLNQYPVLCIATPDGWLKLRKGTLLVTQADRLETIEIPSQEMLDRIVRGHFGLRGLPKGEVRTEGR